MSHRIRTIIPYLNYSELRDTIPKESLFTGIKIGGSFPPLAKKIGYSTFGLFLDHLIRKMLRTIQFGTNWEDKVVETLTEITDEKFDDDILNESVEYYQSIFSFICEEFWGVKGVIEEPEISTGRICGHPDLVIGDTIYDIKTSGNFPAMRNSTIFQLLSYYSIMKENGNESITSIAVILPAQKKVIRHNVSDWTHKRFLKKLDRTVDLKISLTPAVDVSLKFLLLKDFIGSHIAKGRSLYHTLSTLPSHVPFQVFLAGNTATKFKFSDSEIRKIGQLPKKLYIHSPYTLNLSKKEDWIVERTVDQLRIAQQFNSLGVVIHCGKRAKLSQRDAYQNMTDNVIEIAKNASVECPLLIETSAGETGELLSNPEELISFYLLLPEETKKNVQICVDTCHVFSAGYEPIEFLTQLFDNDIPVKLVHFNDSKEKKGCCHDRHAPIGRGFIGLEKLTHIAVQCIEKKIDLVVE